MKVRSLIGMQCVLNLITLVALGADAENPQTLANQGGRQANDKAPQADSFMLLLDDVVPFPLEILPLGFGSDGKIFWPGRRGYFPDKQRQKHDQAIAAIRSFPDADLRLLAMLRTTEPSEFPATLLAIRGFYALGSSANRVIPELTKLLDEPSRSYLAVRALVMVGTEAFPSLINSITNEQRIVRLTAVTALGFPDFRKKESVPTLLRCLDSPDADMRWMAARTLGQIRIENGGVISALLVKSTDPDKEVRISAINALGNFGDSAAQAIPLMESALNDPDASSAAGKALAGIGLKSVPALVIALTNKNDFTRIAAIQALGELHPNSESIVPAIIASVSDTDAHVRSYAAYALSRIATDSEAAIGALTKTLEDKDPNVRQSAADALMRCGVKAKSAAPALRRALDDPSPIVRRSANLALKTMGEQIDR